MTKLQSDKTKNLFLYGESSIGKSTLLFQSLGEADVMPYALGYRTARIINSEDEIIGYAQSDVQSDQEDFHFNQLSDQHLDNQFMILQSGQVIKFDFEVFQVFTIPILKKALQQFKTGQITFFMVMDEIGGMELLNVEIKQVYIEVLNSDMPCIGITKAPFVIEKTKSNKDFLAVLLDSDKTELLNADELSKAEMRECIQEWLTKNKIGEKIG
ncbi:MAG: nucleoside-triphosphatase [Fastidiosipilaceae bacterium]